MKKRLGEKNGLAAKIVPEFAVGCRRSVAPTRLYNKSVMKAYSTLKYRITPKHDYFEALGVDDYRKSLVLP
jgi:hypothetical protein